MLFFPYNSNKPRSQRESCLFSTSAIGVAASATTDRLRDRDNAAGIGDNFSEIGDGAAGIVDIAANAIPC